MKKTFTNRLKNNMVSSSLSIVKKIFTLASKMLKTVCIKVEPRMRQGQLLMIFTLVLR